MMTNYNITLLQLLGNFFFNQVRFLGFIDRNTLCHAMSVLCEQDDIEWCESHTTASWAEGVLGDLSTVSQS